MKQTKRTFFVLLLCGALLLGAAGCGKAETPEDSSIPIADVTGSSSADSTTTTEDTTTTTTTETTTTTTTTTGGITTRNTSRTKTICPTAPPRSTTTTGRTTTTTTTTMATTTTTTTQPPQPQVETQWVLPQVVRQTDTEYGNYDRVILADDGRIVAIGKVKITRENNADSVIDVYDKELVLQDSYRSSYLDGYQLIACAEGGFLMDNCGRLQKLSAQLKPEWSLQLMESSEQVFVAAMTQLSDGEFAVVYRKLNEEMDRIMAWYLALFSEEGQLLCRMDLRIRDSGCEDPALIPDKTGGFYLVLSISPEDTDAPDALRQAIDPAKGRDVAIAHFVPDTAEQAAWHIDSVRTVGGAGDEWCEEAAMDAQGNFYIALGHHGETTDPFWSELVYGSYFRRMLIKVSPAGEVVYRVPLSGRSMAVDQVFGIHIRNGQVCVTGVSNINDGVLAPYAATEQDHRYAVYEVTVDADGALLSRRAFEYDQLVMNTPDGSVWLSDGRLLISGTVCSFDNTFDLEFPEGTDSNRALFIY